MSAPQFAGGARAIRYALDELRNVDDVLRHVVGRNAVVQAGGGLGVFPAYLSQHFKTVYTFEPDPEQFVLMTANAPAPNIVRFQAALGNDAMMVSTSRTRRDGKAMPPHEGITHTVRGGTTPTMRLDTLCLPHLDLLYLDIEGDELRALAGAYTTIALHRPVIACEVKEANLAAVGLQIPHVFDFFEAIKYKYIKKVGNDALFMPAPAAPEIIR